MKVAVAGYGRFGSALAMLVREAGGDFVAYDPFASVPERYRAGSLSALADAASIVVVAVPMAALADSLRALRPWLTSEHLVIDVASVKANAVRALADVLGDAVPWIATHPLFGPLSIAREERPLVSVVCPNATHPEATARARAFYEELGCEVVEEDADAHDRGMAFTHALAFFVAKGLLDIGAGADVSFVPPSFAAMARTVSTVREDAGHLFLPIQNSNPHAAEARSRLLGALGRIHDALADEGRAGELSIAPRIAGPESDTGALLAEIDRELAALRARRVRLVSRTELGEKTSESPPASDSVDA